MEYHLQCWRYEMIWWTVASWGDAAKAPPNTKYDEHGGVLHPVLLSRIIRGGRVQRKGAKKGSKLQSTAKAKQR